MTHLRNNLDPIESSYQLKALSLVKRKSVANPRPIPTPFPEESAEESINLVQGDNAEERFHGPKWMSKDSWMVEIISQFLSILCIVAVIAVLAKFHGSLLESWTSPVSPNAVISVLSTAAKAALILPVTQAISQLKWHHFRTEGRSLMDLSIYDDASRGPMGALSFMWRCRKSSITAYAGCAITIMALTTDPFSQQILSYNTVPTLSPDSVASTSRSLVYDYGAQGQGINDVSGDGVYARDNGMAAAVMTGIYGFQTPIPFQCTSSNCTFPDFTSLGVCDECENVTASTIETCNSTGGFQHFCYYQLPSGAILSGTALDDAHTGFKHTQVNTTVTTVDDAAFKTLNLTQHGAPIMYMGLVIFPYTGGLDFNRWQSGYQVFQCDMYFCAKKFKGMTVKNGTVSTQQILQRDMNGTEEREVSGPLVGLTALQPWEGDSNFNINFYDLKNYYYFLKYVLDFTDYYIEQNPAISISIQGALTTSTSIPGTIAGLATSLTNHILVGPNATSILGDVWVPKTYIHVDWIWLAVPIVLVFASSILLGTVIMLTDREQQPVWKSSLLPMIMLSQPESDAREEFADGEEGCAWTLSQMETRAKNTKSRLQVQRGGRPAWDFN